MTTTKINFMDPRIIYTNIYWTIKSFTNLSFMLNLKADTDLEVLR